MKHLAFSPAGRNSKARIQWRTRRVLNRMQIRSFLQTGFAAWLLGAAAASLAHDTWFHPLASPATHGDIVMALGTGN
jgi:hypothetical protein